MIGHTEWSDINEIRYWKQRALEAEAALAQTVAQLEFSIIEMKNTWEANQTLIEEREYYREIAEVRKGQG